MKKKLFFAACWLPREFAYFGYHMEDAMYSGGGLESNCYCFGFWFFHVYCWWGSVLP